MLVKVLLVVIVGQTRVALDNSTICSCDIFHCSKNEKICGWHDGGIRKILDFRSSSVDRTSMISKLSTSEVDTTKI